MRSVPPSALPGISPSRGEICKMRYLRPKLASRTEHSTVDGRGTVLHRISPLEGEMPGRAEGGMPALQQTRRLTLPFPT